MSNEILKLFLKALCTYGKYSLCNDLELLDYLEKHEENGKLFYIETTTAACGPKLVWYPLERWHEKQQREREFYAELERTRAIISERGVTTKQPSAKEQIEMKLEEAKAAGDQELVKKLELVLTML